MCCGAAGTYNLAAPGDGDATSPTRKLRNIAVDRRRRPAPPATSAARCTSAPRPPRAGRKLRIVHPVELLHRAVFGEKARRGEAKHEGHHPGDLPVQPELFAPPRGRCAGGPDVHQPVPGKVMNHGAFLLGHLAWANDNAVRAYWAGRRSSTRQGSRFSKWAPSPCPTARLYPPKAELLSMLEKRHAQARRRVHQRPAGPARPARPRPHAHRFKTNGHLVVGLMTAHGATTTASSPPGGGRWGFRRCFRTARSFPPVPSPL